MRLRPHYARFGMACVCHSLRIAPSPFSSTSFSLTRWFTIYNARLAVAMSSSRTLVSSRHSHNAARLQFPLLPPQLAELYRPGQMLQHEDALPKLPVPPLQQTLKKYLAAVEPLMSAAELERMKDVVADFARPGGDGEKLQTKLLERASKMDNWLSDWWLNAKFLSCRPPLLVHSNPATILPKQLFCDTENYIRNAAMHLLLSVKWCILTNLEAVPPAVYRSHPQSMSQYKVHSTCRVPALRSDILRRTPIECSRHVIVARKGHFFQLDVLYETAAGDLAVATSSHVLDQLRNILDCTSEPANHPVGLLTAEHRDTWYHARERLRRDPVNQASLEVIETAQLVICLDVASPPLNTPLNKADQSALMRLNLHGNGSRHNSANRWLDQANQLFMNEDGGCGSMIEHSVADGPAAYSVTVFSLDVLNRLKYDVLAESSPVDPALLRPAELLQWNISPVTAQDIDTARINVDKLVDNVDIEAFPFTEFGKGLPKSAKFSPDGFFQMAIQLAYFKLHGKLTGVYESGSSRRFKAGQTDAVRPVSSASLKFVQAMADSSTCVEERLHCLQAALQRHSEYMNDVLAGQGIDRHLLGLMLAAGEAGMERPAFFQDPAVQQNMRFHLFTGQYPVGGHPLFLAYGAVVEDGYSVQYNLLESSFLFTVLSYRSCPHTDSQLLGVKLEEALREMREVVVAAKSVHSNL